MKTLYLVRHAKSSWKEADVPDMDRPLKGRGIRDAYNTSEWLYKQEVQPDYLISSPATRALHTALIFCKSLNYAYSDIKIVKSIYEASTQQMLKVVQGIDDKYSRVFLFGHNPTITDFVNLCIDHRIDNVPTTGVACLEFSSDSWSKIDNRAQLLFFDYPKRRKSR